MGGGGAMEITGALPMMDAGYVEAKTCVWWDIENCGVPRSCDPYSIAQNIKKSLADMNYKGVVTISAYGDTQQISCSVQQALSSTGIALNHVPAGIKDASDKKILVDMLIWGYDNPPPANHLLISGDRDFSNALHQLSLRRYNILLAQPEKVSQALVSAAKTVWLWSSLVLGGRPLEKLPNFHNASTNSKSNIMTESNSIVYPSQPDEYNLKYNNNGNFYNGNKAKQTSKTQSQPVIRASSLKGNEVVYKQSIGSSDSSNPNQENDSKHPNYMVVSTTAELHSNCITVNSNSNIVTESDRILYSSQPDDIYKKSNDSGNIDNHKKEEQISRTQRQPVISTSSSNGNEEGNKQSIGSSDSPNSDQRNDLKHPNLSTQPEKVSQGFVSAPKTAWQWTSLVVGGRPVEKIPNLHDTLANSISNNEAQGSSISCSSQPDDLNQKNSNNGNFDNHSKSKQISNSQSQPIMISSSSTGNEEGSKLLIESSDSSNLNQMDDSNTPDLGSNCIPKSQQLVDSGKSNAPCGPTSGYTPKFKQKIPSYTTMSTTNGSGAQESTTSEMTKVDKNSTLSQPSALVVPECGNPYLSTDPTSSNLNQKNDLKAHPSHTFVSTIRPTSNWKPKIKQEGGNISNTSSSYSTKSSSPVLPESNPTNASKINATVKFAIKKNRNKYHKQQQNQCSQSCFQSRNLSGSNYNHSSSSSTVPTIRPNNYQAVHSTMPSVSISIPDISELNISDTAQNHLVGFFLDKNLPYHVVVNHLLRVWKLRGKVEVKYDNDMFFFEFSSLEDRDKIIESDPFIIFGKVFIVTKWTPTIDRAREQVESIRVWAKISNIPSLYQTLEGLDWIFSHIGKLVCFDEATERRDRLSYARALIEISPKKELPSTIPVYLSDHVTGYVQVSFLWKPPICTGCSSFGHYISSCPHSSPPVVSKQMATQPPLSPLRKSKAREWRIKQPVLDPHVPNPPNVDGPEHPLPPKSSAPLVAASDPQRELCSIRSSSSDSDSDPDDFDCGIEYAAHQILPESLLLDAS